jgi:low affinity Fe/Cu permease
MLRRNGDQDPAHVTKAEVRAGKVRAHEVFHRFAHLSAEVVGSPWAFFLAILVLLAWAVTGPMFGFSDTWQLIINTGTTIVTFLMVFLIQNTQNRDAKAIHLKLDELIWAHRGARNRLVDLEDYSDEELAQIEEEFKRVRARGGRGTGMTDRKRDERHPAHTGHSGRRSKSGSSHIR